MDRIELEAFVTVAEELHFGRAAERLHRGQPAVSDAVKRLEVGLGGRLFDRTSRRVALTELGDALLPDAYATLGQLRNFEQRGRSLAAGLGTDALLVVAHAEYTDHDLLLRGLSRLRNRMPRLSIVPQAMPSGAQIKALRAGTIGLGIGWATGEIVGVGVRLLSSERFVALVSKDHPLAGRSELTATDLSGSNLLTWPHQINSGLCDRLLAAFQMRGAELRIIRTANSLEAIAAHVAAGAGVGITVESALSRRQSDLQIIPFTGASTTADQAILMPESPTASAVALSEILVAASGQQAARAT